MVELRGSDEKGEATAVGDEVPGERKRGLEPLNRAHGDSGSLHVGDVFGPRRSYIDIGQCSCTADFA